MRAMNDWRFLDIAIFLRDDEDGVQGGILGGVWAGWFHIEFLWIADAYRHPGYGDQLIHAAEAEARAFGAPTPTSRRSAFRRARSTSGTAIGSSAN